MMVMLDEMEMQRGKKGGVFLSGVLFKIQRGWEEEKESCVFFFFFFFVVLLLLLVVVI